MPHEQALSHLWLGRLGHSAGAYALMSATEAQQHVRTAMEQFAALGMSPRWVPAAPGPAFS